MILDKDKILSPWMKYQIFTHHHKRSFIEKLFNKDPRIIIKYGFKRILMNNLPLPSYYVFEQNNEWITNVSNRFDKHFKNTNDAMKYVDEELIKEGYYLIDDLEKFEKLKVLI